MGNHEKKEHYTVHVIYQVQNQQKPVTSLTNQPECNNA